MYSIKNQFSAFYKTIDYNLELLQYEYPDKKRNYIYKSGILNNIWQSWSRFWRTLWLANMLGGVDARNRIVPLRPDLDESSAIYLFLYFLKKRPNPNGRINGSFQEPTWGDIDNIRELAININRSSGNNISSAISLFGNTPKHLQIVRNASIHLDRDNMNRVKYILGYYQVSKLEYPTDLLTAIDIKTSKTAIKNWADELVAFLELVII